MWILDIWQNLSLRYLTSTTTAVNQKEKKKMSQAGSCCWSTAIPESTTERICTEKPHAALHLLFPPHTAGLEKGLQAGCGQCTLIPALIGEYPMDCMCFPVLRHEQQRIQNPLFVINTIYVICTLIQVLAIVSKWPGICVHEMGNALPESRESFIPLQLWNIQLQ